MIAARSRARLVRFLRRSWPRHARYPALIHVQELEDVPEDPNPRQFYVVGTFAQPKWVAFDCPCGHGHRIEVNVGRASSWSVTVYGSKATVHPSVDRDDGQWHCHFFVRASKVHWA